MTTTNPFVPEATSFVWFIYSSSGYKIKERYRKRKIILQVLVIRDVYNVHNKHTALSTHIFFTNQ